MIIWQCIFWLCVLLIMHSYLLFPWLLQLLASGKQENELKFSEDEFPEVSVLMSVFNEEKILSQKLDSILRSDYPANKLKIIVGSDASTDATDEILVKYEKEHKNFSAMICSERRGKPALINKLMEKVESGIVIMTDAKVIFHEGTVRGLAAHFKDPAIGIVGGNIINERVQKDGVSIQEKAFMSREILMKYREGLVW